MLWSHMEAIVIINVYQKEDREFKSRLESSKNLIEKYTPDEICVVIKAHVIRLLLEFPVI